MTHPQTAFGRLALGLAVGLLAGWASPHAKHFAGSSHAGLESQELADLQPPVELPPPVARTGGPVPSQALQEYARGRDALLDNQKQPAIDHLTAAVDIDPTSAIAWRDLGYAQTGMDDAKAEAAFRQATKYDPLDADARLQLARLLLDKHHEAEAITELRLARLSPDFADSDGLAAVVDHLLGEALENTSHRAAAIECFENVLAILDNRNFDLRGRPELAEIVARPSVLMLQTADLETQAGQYERAIVWYQRVRTQEPQSEPTIELRLARAQLLAGKTDEGTRRAMAVLASAQCSDLALAEFDELFAPHGGAAGAIRAVDAVAAGVDISTLSVLRSHLLLQQGRTADAVAAVNGATRVDLATVRQTVHAYRAAGGDSGALIRKLLERAAVAPDHWPAIERGLTMLSQLGQPHPLTPDALSALDIAPGLTAARAYAAATLYRTTGRQGSSVRMMGVAKAADAKWIASAALAAVDDVSVLDDDAYASIEELSVVIDCYRDDPDLLTSIVAGVVKENRLRVLEDAFAFVTAKRPADAVVAVTYAFVLNVDKQRTEAYAVLDKAAAKVISAPEVYFIAQQYSTMNDDKATERLLRRACDLDSAFAPASNDLGFMLTDSGRDLPAAEALLNKAVQAEPDNSAYLDSLGWLLYKRTKFADAVKYLEQATTADPQPDPVVLDHAGDAFYQTHEPQKAAARWKQAVDAIKARGTADPQLRLRVDRKLQQLTDHTNVDVAAVARQ